MGNFVRQFHSALKAIIIDDESHARQAVETLLNMHFPQVEVLALCDDVASGVRAIHNHQPDIVFLDIEMPGYSGLRLVEFFNPDELCFHLVFVTAYNQYAVKAFEMSALDYILKPVGETELRRAIDKAERALEQQSLSQRVQSLRANLLHESPQQIALPLAEGYSFVKVDQLVRLEADGPYTHLFLADGSKMLVSKTLKEFDDLLLLSGMFFRPHRSHLINLHEVKKYVKSDGGWILMSDGTNVPVSRHKKAELNETIQRFAP